MANSVGSDDISSGEETETQKGKVIDLRTQSVKGLRLVAPRVISGHSSYVAWEAEPPSTHQLLAGIKGATGSLFWQVQQAANIPSGPTQHSFSNTSGVDIYRPGQLNMDVHAITDIIYLPGELNIYT